MKLYELIDRYAALCDLAFDESDDDGQVSEEFSRMLQALEGDIDTKFEQCGFALRNMQAMADALDAEAKRLAKRRDKVTDRIERLKGYLKSEMQRLGQTKRQAGMFTFSIRANGGSPAVKVLDERAIPEEFWVNPDPVLDKKAICEAAGRGVAVPGVELVRGEHLRVI